MKQQAVVYIGDFDLRNENVQAHLVKNNGKLFNSLGYAVFFIGTNRNCFSFNELNSFKPIMIENGDYFELPHTLTIKGLLYLASVESKVLRYLDQLGTKFKVKYIVTYQSPTYAGILKKIALWCKKNESYYIVNCADLPVFDSQPFFRRIVMRWNWWRLHTINKRYADGVICVSRYIDDFYKKEGRPSVIIPPLFCKTDLPETNVVKNNVPTFLYAGTPFVITGHKVDTRGMKDRLDKVIDLMLKLEQIKVDFRFDIIGIGLEDYCDCIPRHKKALKESKNIIFNNRKSHMDTLRFIRCSDFSISYRDENLMTKAGFPTKVVESISMGTPVIINRISDIQMYLSEGISCFTLSDNFSENVEKLKQLCNLSKDARYRLKLDLINQNIFDLSNYIDKLAVFLKLIK